MHASYPPKSLGLYTGENLRKLTLPPHEAIPTNSSSLELNSHEAFLISPGMLTVFIMYSLV